MRNKSKVILVAGIAIALPVAALAQFGVSVVTDLSQEIHSWEQLTNDVQKIALAADMANTLLEGYQMMQNNIRFFQGTVRGGWRAAVQPFYVPNTHSVFGEADGWTNAVGQATSVAASAGVWGSSTVSPNVSPLLGNDQMGSATMAKLASVEIADGSAPVAMGTIGAVRSNQAADQVALQALSKACSSDINNAMVQQQNCAVDAQIFAARNQETANALLVSSLEQQVYATKRQRDQDAADLQSKSTWLNVCAADPNNCDFPASFGDPNQ